MPEENLDKIIKKLYEHPFMTQVEDKVAEIASLRFPKPYNFMTKRDIIEELHSLILQYLSKFNPTFIKSPSFRLEEKEKSKVILYIFNHPDFQQFYQGFLEYVNEELNKTIRDSRKNSFLSLDFETYT